MTLNGSLPLHRIFGHSLLWPAGVFGCCLIAVVLALYMPLKPASAAGGPFADFAGTWSGGGTLRPQNGAAERIRCNATYQARGQREVNLQLRCASDSYNFNLSGDFAADADNQVTGRWTEHTRSTGGTAIGMAQGDRLQLHIESAGFSAQVVMITRSRQQSVNIDSHGAGQVVRASITLSRS
jgi:hypothetical protein